MVGRQRWDRVSVAMGEWGCGEGSWENLYGSRQNLEVDNPGSACSETSGRCQHSTCGRITLRPTAGGFKR